MLMVKKFLVFILLSVTKLMEEVMVFLMKVLLVLLSI